MIIGFGLGITSFQLMFVLLFLSSHVQSTKIKHVEVNTWLPFILYQNRGEVEKSNYGNDVEVSDVANLQAAFWEKDN